MSDKKTSSQKKKQKDLRSIPLRQRKPYLVGKITSKRGKVCGSNHQSCNAEARKKHSITTKESIKRGCPFYMVDGISIEYRETSPLNTNSGVLLTSNLQELQN